jgi:ABC-type iron transport system FetAB permease component
MFFTYMLLLTFRDDIYLYLINSRHIFRSITDVFAMILIATHESLSRQKYRYKYNSLVTFLTIFTSITAVGSFAFLLVVRPEPYWNPQYVIPICGMLVSDEECTV